jgi:hypothetical protein
MNIFADEELKQALTDAGNKYDGHVTNGSLAAQLTIIEKRFYVDNTDLIYEAARELIAKMDAQNEK